jgi:glycosyltransferase involved in cell wall biosynthesis
MSIPSNAIYGVSAIVSAYNSERYITGRLQNLIDQSLYQKNHLEIFVVIPCSPQNEGQYVKDLMRQFKHIVYVRIAERESVHGAWNLGIRLVNGKYIINENADDHFLPPQTRNPMLHSILIWPTKDLNSELLMCRKIGCNKNFRNRVHKTEFGRIVLNLIFLFRF